MARETTTTPPTATCWRRQRDLLGHWHPHAGISACGRSGRGLRVCPEALAVGAGRQQRPLRIGFIGINRANGSNVLLEPLALLGPMAPLELVLYGNPNDDPFYAKQLRHLADPMPQVRWGGVFGSDQVFAVLAQLDLLVVPSLWRENAPLIVLQALASGLPLPLSYVEGMADQVQPGNSCALAGLIQQLEQDPQRLAALVNQGGSPRTITDYSDHLEQIYAQLVRG